MPVQLIAEIGVNHNGSPALARRMIREAARQGADAVKFQSFKVERLIVAGARKAAYQERNTGRAETQDAMLRRLALGFASQRSLKTYAARAGVEFMSSPFDDVSLAELVRLRVRRLKMPSGEITNGPLLLAAARTGLPILLSTGMASVGEVEDALGVLAFGMTRTAGRPSGPAFRDALSHPRAWSMLRERVTLLHCTTQYPTPFADVNLRAIETLKRAFGLPVGYSDHTPGIAISLAAVALGATVIEKHFTLDRGLPGPDHRASLEPAEFGEMVRGVRAIEAAAGDGIKRCAPSELPNRAVARKSLVAAAPIAAGHRLTTANLTAKRPGTGRSPMEYWDLIGTIAPRAFNRDEPV